MYAISIHKHSHLNDGIRAVLFGFAVFFVTIFLLQLKIVIRTVVIEDLIIAFSKKVAVFIYFRLDKIAFIAQNIKSPVYIMQLIRRFFQKFRSCLIRRTFTGWFKDSGIDKIGENRINIIFKSMLVSILPGTLSMQKSPRMTGSFVQQILCTFSFRPLASVI